MLKIVTTPNPLLKKKSKPIKAFDSRLTKFISELEETLVKKKDPPGIGISAVQVGKLIRAFCTLLPAENVVTRQDLEGKKFTVKTYLNPQIVKASKELTLFADESSASSKKTPPFLEGCLSIPKIYGPVYRHSWIQLKYSAISHKPYAIRQRVQRFSGFTARVIQHEMDHLDGILFTDRAIKQKLPIYEEKNGKLVEINL